MEKQITGLFGASTVVSARNKGAMSRMERRLGLVQDAVARHPRQGQEAKRRRRPRRRAISGEWIEDMCGAVWSAVWRRGA